MQVRTCITLSAETLAAVDLLAASGSSRSRVIVTALREYLARRERAIDDARDLAVLNRHADELNAEMADILRYQGRP